jgi:hypothetical protein
MLIYFWLPTYIEKHQEEIIDYDRRKKAGKDVGLNREQEDEMVQNQSSSNAVKNVVVRSHMEKGFDNVIEKASEILRTGSNQKEEVHNQSSAKAAKKVVGSGCVEKACDNVIGKRQKRKAMSLRKLGSRSLAILKVVELNNKWLDIWRPKIAANDLQQAANDPCGFSEFGLVT